MGEKQTPHEDVYAEIDFEYKTGGEKHASTCTKNFKI